MEPPARLLPTLHELSELLVRPGAPGQGSQSERVPRWISQSDTRSPDAAPWRATGARAGLWGAGGGRPRSPEAPDCSTIVVQGCGALQLRLQAGARALVPQRAPAAPPAPQQP